MKLDPAALHVCFLLDRDHLAFHLGKLGRRLFVAADKERSWPKDNDRCRSRQSVICALAVLDTGKRRRPGRDRLGFLGELLASVF